MQEYINPRLKKFLPHLSIEPRFVRFSSIFFPLFFFSPQLESPRRIAGVCPVNLSVIFNP